ncbi:MAG TPA: sigma-70 family RNA polymerase sigma factor [Candidatus Bilamarchaeum sp.]|nr:sigma-70 family RNA polymerase sigma factor [Candidatus Bilamarchaeum sp.]
MVLASPLQASAAPHRPKSAALEEYIRKTEPVDRAVREYALCGKPKASYQQVFLESMPLVQLCAGTVRRRFPILPQDDVMSAGALGLAEGLERYQLIENIPPSAYLGKRVRGAMLNLLPREKPPESIDERRTGSPPTPEQLVGSSEILQMVFSHPLLGQRERDILHAYFFTDATQRQIAGEFGLLQPAVCKIIAKALAKLRQEFE